MQFWDPVFGIRLTDVMLYLYSSRTRLISSTGCCGPLPVGVSKLWEVTVTVKMQLRVHSKDFCAHEIFRYMARIVIL